MKKEFEDLFNYNYGKTDYTPDEMIAAKRLLDIRNQQNSIPTDIVLWLSPLLIIACIVNLFYPIFMTQTIAVLAYLAAIPAVINVAVKIREQVIKSKFMKEYEVSNSDIKDMLQDEQTILKLEELVEAINQQITTKDFNLNLEDSDLKDLNDVEVENAITNDLDLVVEYMGEGNLITTLNARGVRKNTVKQQGNGMLNKIVSDKTALAEKETQPRAEVKKSSTTKKTTATRRASKPRKSTQEEENTESKAL